MLSATVFAGFSGESSTDTAVIHSLDKVVVTASRRQTRMEDTPDITYVISDEDIRNMGAKSISDILEYVPGVSLEAGTGGGQPFKKTVTIDGMPVEYNLVMVDGARVVSSHIHTGSNVNVVPPENIERIEIVKGAASAQYGSDAMAGVINIITKRGTTQPKLHAAASAGSENTYRSSLSVTGPIDEKIRHSVFTSWEQTDGMPITMPKTRVGAYGYKRLDIQDRVDVDFDEGTSGYASVRYMNSRAPFGDEMVDSWHFTPSIGVSTQLTSDLQLNLGSYYTRWNSEKNNERNEIATPEVMLGYKGLDKHHFIIGGEYIYRRFHRKRVEKRGQHLIGGFIQDEFTPLEQLTLLAALRFDDVSDDTIDIKPVFSPKASLLYRPVSQLDFRLSVGRAFRAPTVQALFETLYGHANDQHFRAGNPDLKPEYSTNITGGIEWRPLKRLSFTGSGYYNMITDMITPVDHGLQSPTTYFDSAQVDFITDSLVYIYRRENIHEAIVAGGEIKVDWQVMKGYNIGAGFGLVHNENKGTGQTLPYSPGKSAFVKLTGAQPLRQDFLLNGYVGLKAKMDRQIWKYKHKGPQVLTLDDYQKLDAGLGLKFFDRYEIFLAGENLLGQELHSYEDKELRTEGVPLYSGGVRISAF